MNNEAKPFRCFGYVDVRDKKERQVFIEYLEAHGFKCDEDEVTTRQSTIDSIFPITVDTLHKSTDTFITLPVPLLRQLQPGLFLQQNL